MKVSFFSVHFQIYLLDNPHLEAAQYTYILLKILQKGQAILYLSYTDFYLWCLVCVHACAQWCLTLCHPMDYSPPGSSVHGISQKEYWSRLPFPPPGNLPDSEIKPTCPVPLTLAGTFFTIALFGKPQSGLYPWSTWWTLIYPTRSNYVSPLVILPMDKIDDYLLEFPVFVPPHLVQASFFFFN